MLHIIVIIAIVTVILMRYFVRKTSKAVSATLTAKHNMSFTDKSREFHITPIPTTYKNVYFNQYMSLTVADFYWASSRKSYLVNSETYGKADYQPIMDALHQNARVINLDVYSSNRDNPLDPTADPVIRCEHFRKTDVPLVFRQTMETIFENAWLTNSDYPLILSFTNNFADNKFILAKMAAIIADVFSSALLDKKYGFNGRNNMFPLGKIPISEMMGRVAIVVDTYPNSGVFDELVNGVVNPANEYIRLIEYHESTSQYGGLNAVMSDTHDLIEHARENLTYVMPVVEYDATTIIDPAIDIYNPDPEDAWSYGCQLVFMNYQVSASDKNMAKYHEKFSSGGLQLRPDALRNIPKPKPPIKVQSREMSFAPRQISVHNGWGSLSI